MLDWGTLPCKESSGFVRGWINTTNTKHRGVDISFTEASYMNKVHNVAWDDGKVIRVWTGASGGDWGNCLIIEHTYINYKRWSGYFHFAKIDVKPGDYVKLGQELGLRGNTGKSTAEHLHFQITKELPIFEVYSDSKFNSYAIDPLPLLFKSEFNEVLSPYFLEVLKPMPTYPTPVERNKDIRQVEVLMDVLYMRASANGEIHNKYCPVGIYNILDEKDAGNYHWYLIHSSNGKEFWIASGGSRTKDLPVENEVETLKKEISLLNEQVNRLSLSLVESNGKLEQIKNIL